MKYSFFKQTTNGIILVIITLIVVIICILPFTWGLITSLKTARELMIYPPKFINFTVSFEHYIRVLNGSFVPAAINSIIFCITAVLLGITFALLCGYAMARFVFKGKKAVFFIILSAIPLAVGSAAMVVPNYMMFSYFGMVNKWTTLPIIYISYNLPLVSWIMIGSVKSVPQAIEEAAKIDGATRWYIIFNLIPNICLPAIACGALLFFIGAWNEFAISSVLVNSISLYPIQVSIYNYIGYFGREWGPLTAAATLAVIPVLIVFTMLGKMLISGLTAGSVKE